MDFKRSLKKISLDKITNEMVKLDKDINRVLSKTGYGCDNIQHNKEDLTEKFFYFQYCSVVDQLENVHKELNHWLSLILDKDCLLVDGNGQKKTRSNKKISLQEITKNFVRVGKGIKRVLSKTGYDCDNIQYDFSKTNERTLFVEYRSIATELENIHMLLDYLLHPVVEEECVSKDRNGRYVMPSGTELINGNKCEVLCEVHGKEEWIYTVIEKGEESYYASALGEGTSIEGLKVRLRM
ncbi:hypothetical protein [Bacillus pseudomycoides]|uniref:hypothetical protein n=1 Tax=Bacillus pseudomycoides TaxID=64104 RepID=UPI000BEB4ABB|nr:hypothetical protein [Bacillus pseudomycoides]PEB42261.1 hypothetical protein COO06_08090 [Bacillus pseudomycoides]